MKNLYTKVPHWFFELAPKLKEAEFRVLTAIVRQTYGWNRKSDKISWSQLEDMTGMSAQGVSNGLAGLEKRGLIIRDAKAVVAQAITITPQNSEILATIGLSKVESETQLSRVQGLSKVESKTNEVESPRKPIKETIKETPTTEKLSDSQEESLALVVVAGLDLETSRRLILTAWKNGHDSKYISDLLGYVAEIKPNNPAGYIRRMIERDSSFIATSKGAEAPTQPKQGINMSKWEHGGIHHSAVSHSCEICHPELIAQRQAQEAEWSAEDQEEDRYEKI